MKRYSVIGATRQQLELMGAIDIVEVRNIGVIFATLNSGQVESLTRSGCKVAEVASVKAAVITTPTPVPTTVEEKTTDQVLELLGMEAIRNLTVPPLYGEGFTVAVIDSGILETHDTIKGGIVYSKNFTSSPMQDGFNHGTGVASIIRSVAPKCGIANIKVLDDEGKGTEESVVLGIDDVLSLYDANPDISLVAINLSLGSPDDGNVDSPVRVACRAAVERGIFVIAAAGNDGPDPETILCPACEHYVVATGSTRLVNDTFELSQFSSRGPTKEGLIKPDVIMVGEGVRMASSIDSSATIVKSGTSFSAPFMSGIIPLFYEGMSKTISMPGGYPTGVEPTYKWGVSLPTALDYFLPKITIKPANVPPGKDCDYGYGVPFGPLAAQALSSAISGLSISGMMTPVLTIFVVGLMTVMMRRMWKH